MIPDMYGFVYCIFPVLFNFPYNYINIMDYALGL